MTPTPALTGLAIVVGQTVLLFWLSRGLLLGYVMRTLASTSSSPRARRLLTLLRLPGNLLHELSHAAAYLATGYRVGRFATCWSDPEGRGYVETGSPWFPLHFAPFSAAMSCAAPLIVGALAIHALGRVLGIPWPTADVSWQGVRPAAVHLLGEIWRLGAHLDWSAWQTYVFAVLALSIGAELAPSSDDLRQGFVMLCVLVLLLALGILALPHMDLEPETARALWFGAQWLLGTLSTALFAGLVGCGLVGLVAGTLAWVLRRSVASTSSRRKSRPPSLRSQPPSGRCGQALGRR